MKISGYLEHFGLTREAFSVTSDPAFLYLSASHEEALAHLIFCVEMSKGFAAIIGEIGTGKTTLLNEMLIQLDDSTAVAFVYQSANTTLELMRYIFNELGLSSIEGDKTAYLDRFNRYLIEQDAAGRTVVLVIDEGQNLSVDVLEDLRLISNFETPSKKLVQIVLAGQNELGAKLKLPELRQLNQRIAIQYRLKPLNFDEVQNYIQHRLNIAGANRVDIFQVKAIKLLQAASGGVPRLVNQICDAALLRSSLQGKQVITPAIIKQVLKEDFEFRGEAEKNQDHLQSGVLAHTSSWSGAKIAASTLLLIVAMGVSWSLGRGGFRAEAVLKPIKSIEGLQQDPIDIYDEPFSQDAIPSHSDLDTVAEFASTSSSYNDAVVQKEGSSQTKSEIVSEKSYKNELQEKELLHLVGERKPSLSRADNGFVLQVRPGNRLSQLLKNTYGFSSWDLIQRVVQANPRIENPNLILVGDWVFFPQFDADTLASLNSVPNISKD